MTRLNTCSNCGKYDWACQGACMEYKREDYLRDFKIVLDDMLEITTKKNNDYGGATDPFKNFREFGELGILVRMSDKFARIKTTMLEKRELMVKDETVTDSITDLAVYAVILRLWRMAEKMKYVEKAKQGM